MTLKHRTTANPLHPPATVFTGFLGAGEDPRPEQMPEQMLDRLLEPSKRQHSIGIGNSKDAITIDAVLVAWERIERSRTEQKLAEVLV